MTDKDKQQSEKEDSSQSDFEKGYEGIVDAVKEKAGDAYEWTKTKREEHPVADFALNFIPVVGTVAAADDVVNDVKKEDYREAIVDAVGLLPAVKLVSKGFDAVMSADNAIRKALISKGYSATDVNDVSTAFLSATGIAATGEATNKAVDLVDEETKSQADKKAESEFKKGYEGKDSKTKENKK